MAKAASPGLLTALLLATCGGLLDSVTYLVHHGVFSSALSGNVVLLAVDLMYPNMAQALRHLVPIVATLAGIFLARAIRTEPADRAITLSLLLEAALLLLCGLLTQFLPGPLIVAIAAFAGAFQISNFRRVDHLPYSSTFVTGNLRDATEGLFEALDHGPEANPGTRQRGRRKARDLFLATLAFLLGVAAGAALAPHFHDRAYWAAIPLLLVALVPNRPVSNRLLSHKPLNDNR